jgi:uncharacterized repeat protein (TIGR02543 family)
MTQKRKAIAFIATLALLAACLPASPLTAAETAFAASTPVVTFDANGGYFAGGETAVTRAAVSGGGVTGPMPAAAYDGHVFIGWFEDTAGTIATDPAIAIYAADATVYAGWLETVKITFDANGGRFAGGAARITLEAISGGALLSSVPTKPAMTGQAFVGWFADPTGTTAIAPESTVFVTNTAIYAGWKKGVKVTFDANGGQFPGGAARTTADAISGGGLADPLPANPTRADYSFANWSSSKSNNVPIKFATAVFTTNTAIYAWWVKTTEVKLTFNANGGKFAGGAVVKVLTVRNPGTATIASISALLGSGPSRSGYNLNGWYDTSASSGGNALPKTNFAVTGSKTYYARWTSRGIGGGSGGSGGGSGGTAPKQPDKKTTSGAVGGGSVAAGPLTRFADASAISSWALPFFERLVRDGVIAGYEDGTLKPKGNVTRAEFTKMIVTALKITAGGSPKSFPADVRQGDWHKQYVDIASGRDIVKGVSATSFAPDARISRQDLAVIAYRALAYAKTNTPAPDGARFADDGQIADYAKEAVYALRKAGIISGRDNGAFDPRASATREETAKIICGVADQAAANV